MKSSVRPAALRRQSQIDDLAVSVAWLIRRSAIPAMILLVAESAVLLITGQSGAAAFAMIAAGTVLICAAWQSNALGLPILPLVAVQNLLVYGLPIVIGHELLGQYSGDLITRAGLEVLIFSVALVAGWRVGMALFPPSSAVSYALHGFNRDRGNRLRRLGFSLVVLTTAYLVAQSLGWLTALYNFLPSGSFSLLSTLFSATGVCGFFLVAMFVGTGALPAGARFAFWFLLALNCIISASGFLLSATTAVLASVLIGLFWSTGRMPWRYLLIVTVAISFLNLGKFTMRERYWPAEGEPELQFELATLPGYYAEWAEASYAALAPVAANPSVLNDTARTAKAQTLLERINNLQNLLFVIDALDSGHIKPLYGETYTLIPPLLVPRIFWPEKPRTHEGQILLNVHFGRQDLDSTLQTYIAWGLLPEACGNFGEKFGGLILGLVLGVAFAWLESRTAHKLLLSLEGFISFTILLSMANSFEMVASVLVTTIFQSVILLVVAGAPFVERTQVRRPESSPP